MAVVALIQVETRFMAAADIDQKFQFTLLNLDQGRRFPIAAPEPLGTAFTDAGLIDVALRPIVIPTVFADFDDYWQPFLGGTGSAPTYVAGLRESERAVLRDRLRMSLVAEADGSIRLDARAWAVRARRPG